MIKKIITILEPKQRLKLAGVLLIILINSGLELLGVSGVMPLIEAVTRPDAIEDSKVFSIAGKILHTQDTNQLIAAFAIALAAVYIIKNLYIIWMNSVLYHFTTYSQKDLAVRLTECYMNQDYAFHVEHNLAELQRNVENDVSNLFTALLNILELTAEVLVCVCMGVFLAFTDLATTLMISALMVMVLIISICSFIALIIRIH